MKLPIRSTAGPLAVWHEPQDGPDYVIGVDSAEGVRGGDYSAAVVIRADTCAVVAVMRQHLDPSLWGMKCADLGWWYRTAMLGFESFPAAHGAVACRAAVNVGYNRIYKRIITSSAAPQPTEKLGWHTDRATSASMVSRVDEAMRANVIIPSKDIIRELMGLKYDETVKIITEGHDDLYDALAIALCVRDQCAMRREIKVEVQRELQEHERFWEHVALMEQQEKDEQAADPVLYDGAIL